MSTRQYHVVAESKAPLAIVYDEVACHAVVNAGAEKSGWVSNSHRYDTVSPGSGSVTAATENVGLSSTVTALSTGEGDPVAAGGGAFKSYVVTSVAKNAFFEPQFVSSPLNITA